MASAAKKEPTPLSVIATARATIIITAFAASTPDFFMEMRSAAPKEAISKAMEMARMTPAEATGAANDNPTSIPSHRRSMSVGMTLPHGTDPSVSSSLWKSGQTILSSLSESSSSSSGKIFLIMRSMVTPRRNPNTIAQMDASVFFISGTNSEATAESTTPPAKCCSIASPVLGIFVIVPSTADSTSTPAGISMKPNMPASPVILLVASQVVKLLALEPLMAQGLQPDKF
mmetsp:Transcript_33031/g.60737  ORF Transcript_33031/g.60737 Transcript_33031/m.60737 type:complete len:230 (+) Transcript_33031:676-1365(+)